MSFHGFQRAARLQLCIILLFASLASLVSNQNDGLDPVTYTPPSKLLESSQSVINDEDRSGATGQSKRIDQEAININLLRIAPSDNNGTDRSLSGDASDPLKTPLVRHGTRHRYDNPAERYHNPNRTKHANDKDEARILKGWGLGAGGMKLG